MGGSIEGRFLPPSLFKGNQREEGNTPTTATVGGAGISATTNTNKLKGSEKLQ